MNEQSISTGEGNPAAERAEQHILGSENYQKAEVVHRFAETHPWFHLTLAVGAVVIVLGITFFVRRYIRSKAD